MPWLTRQTNWGEAAILLHPYARAFMGDLLPRIPWVLDPVGNGATPVSAWGTEDRIGSSISELTHHFPSSLFVRFSALLPTEPSTAQE